LLIDAEMQLIQTKFSQDQALVEVKDYDVGAYVNIIRNSQDKVEFARERYGETRQAYQMRFGEFYDPAETRRGEVAERRRNKEIELEEWKKSWHKDTQTMQWGCMLLWFAILGVISLLTWVRCSVLNWC
jgi:hypothetical protein